MPAADQSEEARAWLRAEIDAQCFGEEFGFDVAPQLLPAAGGVQLQYLIAITARSPLLGQPPLMHVTGIPQARLNADLAREVVTNALRGLRELSAKMLAGADGKPA